MKPNSPSQPIKILRDTAEKENKGWFFSDYKDVVVSSENLLAGDYTIVGHDQPRDDNSIIIERKKDCRELIGNLGTKWEQFLAEAELLQQYKYRQIVVCGPENFDFLYARDYTKMSPNFIYSRLAYLKIYFDLSVVFFDNIKAAENYVYRLFKMVNYKTNQEM